MEDKENENIEIVSGDGSTLDISPVYEHIEPEKPNTNNRPKNIIVPVEKNSDNQTEPNESNEENVENKKK